MNPATHRPAIFRYMAARPDREITLDELITAVYGGEPPSAAKASVRSMIARLRVELADHGGEIHFVGRGYRYTPGPTVPTFKEVATAYPWLPEAVERREAGASWSQLERIVGINETTIRRHVARAQVRETHHA